MARKKLIKRITVPEIRERKGAQPIVCLTSYTAPVAEMVDPHVDLILVGDSVAMVLYGMESTLGISLETMIEHGRAVVRASQKALVAVDMPFGSYQESKEQAFRNASQIMCETGCQAVKLEGGIEYINQIKEIIKSGIPVMGHIGLTPQSVLQESGYKIQGKKSEDAFKIYKDALLFEDAGVFALVLEGVPEDLAEIITAKLNIPTIGIGAGKHCDGQIQVLHDLIGWFGLNIPKHAKAYTNIEKNVKEGIQQYQNEVKNQQFPSNVNTNKMKPKELLALKKKIEDL